MSCIAPVILSGGSGERLWPISRKSYPKQFLQLLGDSSLFQQAVTRFKGLAPLVITGEDYRFVIGQQLLLAGVDNADIIIEPESKNTAPAILAAAVHLASRDPELIMLVMPSDHHIPDARAFSCMAEDAATRLTKGQIICFGITPDRPETAYGYIKIGESESTLKPVTAFTEKPDAEIAAAFLKDGGYLWNAGIFMMRAGEFLHLAAELQPEMLTQVTDAVKNMKNGPDFLWLEQAAWSRAQAESFDYAFMEKASFIGFMVCHETWSDLGDWRAIAREKQGDSDGNVLHGSAYQVDSKNTLLWSGKEGQVLAGVGLENIIAVATGDAVLVADRASTQEIKAMVDLLRKNGVEQATNVSLEPRPWGWFETIAQSEHFKVKILHVTPGGQLSLQSHKHRSEHWVVVKGEATVLRNDERFLMQPDDSIFIAVGDKHQLSNEGEDDLEIIEVQTGQSFDESDITRFEDKYNRV